MDTNDIKRLRDALEDVGSLRGIPSPRLFSRYDKGAYEMIRGVAPKLREAVAAIDTLTSERDEALAEVERLRGNIHDAAVIYGQMRAEAERAEKVVERVRGAPDMWCQSCGTVTRDGECDCTFTDASTQRLIPYVEAILVETRMAVSRAEFAERAEADMADLLRRADRAVIWERYSTLTDGFQEEVERALAPYDAASAPAEPAGAPQVDIVVDGDAEGGSGETKTFARPLTWNVMGDGK